MDIVIMMKITHKNQKTITFNSFYIENDIKLKMIQKTEEKRRFQSQSLTRKIHPRKQLKLAKPTD